MRKRSERDLIHASLFSGLYLHAITKAIAELPEHGDRRWAQTMLKRLEDKGVQTDQADLQSQALHFAQLLMEQPLGKHMEAAFREDE